MHRIAGYTKWDHERNEDILQELGLEPVLQYIHQYLHVKRMPRSRIPEWSSTTDHHQAKGHWVAL